MDVDYTTSWNMPAVSFFQIYQKHYSIRYVSLSTITITVLACTCGPLSARQRNPISITVRGWADREPRMYKTTVAISQLAY